MTIMNPEHEVSLNENFETLKKDLASYYPDCDIALLDKAYKFAKESHITQARKSGEPYIFHPLAVAQILADMRLDLITIITGLLHDTVEDTSATLEIIQQEFGTDVAELVDGVTKLSKINFRSTHEKQAENFRKMLLAMAKDLRVILVKLADRTHNMRTMQSMAEAKQNKIAQETLDIYAPLANRLGISWMKIELEDLSLRYTHPETYYKLTALVEKTKREREKYIDKVKNIIFEKLSEYGLKCEVMGRAKHFYSILKKMESRNLPFDEINDLIAFRIITNSIAECYEALGIIHSFYKPVPGRFKDYIAMPKNNLYQSLHTTVIGPFSERLEIQIRTADMHRTAEAGIAAHWKYKDGKISKKDYERFHWLRQLVETQEEIDNPVEFIETVKLDLFSKDVYVFTPKGEIIEFPYGSTPLDFAFAIHTDVGFHCTGAKVNGRIVSLKHKLRSGDVIEITTSPTQKPNKDWLKYVKTGKAKNKIRQYIKSEERERSKELGRDLLDREMRKAGKSFAKFEKQKDIDSIIKNISYANLDEVLTTIGYGKVGANRILKRLFPEEFKNKPDTLQIDKTKFSENSSKSGNTDSRNSKGAVKIHGIDDVLVRFGNCCLPLPGDEIIGYITRGRGVTVHKIDCNKVLELDPDRAIDVEWTQGVESFRQQVRVKVTVNDEPGLLNKMSQIITGQGINITSLTIKVNAHHKGTGIFHLEVKNKTQLITCLHALESIPGVISVDRV